MEIKIHNIGDNIGPEKILLLRQPRIGLEAIVVVDNVACGPAIAPTCSTRSLRMVLEPSKWASPRNSNQHFSM